MIHGGRDGTRQRMGLVRVMKPPYTCNRTEMVTELNLRMVSVRTGIDRVNIHVKFIGSSTVLICGWRKSVILMISSPNTS